MVVPHAVREVLLGFQRSVVRFCRLLPGYIEVWLTQVMDALTGSQEEEAAELQPEFAASLRRSLEQAYSGEGIDLQTFCLES